MYEDRRVRILEVMFQSYRYSHLILRLSLAGVFLWFGIGKFMQPQYWADAWLPRWAGAFAATLGMSPVNAMVLLGIFEVLVAASLATGFFDRWFASAAALFLFVILFSTGLNEILVRDVGLIGALLALAAWPQRRYS